MSDKYYLLETKFIYNNKNVKRTYYITVIENNDNTYNVNVGGLKNFCITIEIKKNKKIANIQTYGFHPKCCINGKLEKRKDMENFMKCSLVFTIGMFKNIHKFILTDNSYITCDNNRRLSLSSLHYIKYGLSYYENRFQAIPYDDNEIKNVKLLLTKVFVYHFNSLLVSNSKNRFITKLR